jgi:hypothetical protein
VRGKKKRGQTERVGVGDDHAGAEHFLRAVFESLCGDVSGHGRYIVVLLEQPGRIAVGGMGQQGFNMRGYIGQYGLKPVCAFLFYGHQ